MPIAPAPSGPRRLAARRDRADTWPGAARPRLGHTRALARDGCARAPPRRAAGGRTHAVCPCVGAACTVVEGAARLRRAERPCRPWRSGSRHAPSRRRPRPRLGAAARPPGLHAGAATPEAGPPRCCSPAPNPTGSGPTALRDAARALVPRRCARAERPSRPRRPGSRLAPPPEGPRRPRRPGSRPASSRRAAAPVPSKIRARTRGSVPTAAWATPAAPVPYGGRR
jgi:hypothetical protein